MSNRIPEPMSADAVGRPSGRPSADVGASVRPSGMRAACWRGLAFVFFALGSIGLVAPLAPTTVFWILAAWCAAKADPALAARIRAWPGVGPAVSDFLDHGVIAPGAKGAALVGMGLSAALAAWALPIGWALWAALAGVAVGAAYVLSRPSHRAAGPLASE